MHHGIDAFVSCGRDGFAQALCGQVAHHRREPCLVVEGGQPACVPADPNHVVALPKEARDEGEANIAGRADDEHLGHERQGIQLCT